MFSREPPIAIANKDIWVKKKGKFDVIESYRNYYRVEKRAFAKWKKREIPDWMIDNNTRPTKKLKTKTP